jgi:hypothetical protein
MEITKQEANLALTALDKVSVQGIQAQKAVLMFATRLEAFINTEEPEVDGDDVPEPAE